MIEGGGLFLLFLLLLALKLTEVITWSWWWVTAPLWGGPALIGLAVIGIAATTWVTARRKNATRSAG